MLSLVRRSLPNGTIRPIHSNQLLVCRPFFREVAGSILNQENALWVSGQAARLKFGPYVKKNFSDGIVKDAILGDTEYLRDRIDTIGQSDLNTAVYYYEMSKRHVNHQEYNTARYYFSRSLEFALKGFHCSNNARDFIKSTWIMVISLMHTSHLYYPGPNGELCNKLLLSEDCKSLFQQLLSASPCKRAFIQEKLYTNDDAMRHTYYNSESAQIIRELRHLNRHIETELGVSFQVKTETNPSFADSAAFKWNKFKVYLKRVKQYIFTASLLPSTRMQLIVAGSFCLIFSTSATISAGYCFLTWCGL
jgi:hypothetical protein